MPRAAVILNPVSGSPRAEGVPAAFESALREAGWEVRSFPTERARHGTELARAAAADGFDVVIAAGGDGTINDVACGLLAAGPAAPPLALLPCGTSNLVARELGVALSARGAASIVAAGRIRAIDVAQVGDRTMLACAGAGWDAHVVRALAERRRGHIRLTTWLGPIAASLRGYGFPEFRVAVDGGAEVSCILALVMNCRPYARFLRPAPEASPTDGVLDVVLVRPAGRGRIGRLAWRAWRGRLAGDAAVVAVRGRHVRIACDAPVPVQVDGDDAGDAPVDVSVRPAALRVMVPRDVPGVTARPNAPARPGAS